MNWLAIVAMVFQYGPSLFQALAALFAAIKAKNVTQGADAVSKGAQIAKQVVVSLDSRTGMTNEQKRDQAWRDVVAGGKAVGITISESEARTLAELALQGWKSEQVPSDSVRTIGLVR